MEESMQEQQHELLNYACRKKACKTSWKELGQTECKKSISQLLKKLQKKVGRNYEIKNAKGSNELGSREGNKGSKELGKKVCKKSSKELSEEELKIVAKNILYQ